MSPRTVVLPDVDGTIVDLAKLGAGGGLARW